MLAIEGGTSAASGNAGASAGEFRSTCWECRKESLHGGASRGNSAVRRAMVRDTRPATGRQTRASRWDHRARSGHRQQRWNAHFVELERFKGLYGHCSVPQSGRVHGERWCRLARWASKQRQMQRGGVLAPERTAKLLQLGFDFGNNTFVAAWEGHFAELVLFKQHRGHCEVPLKSPAGVSSSFRAWVDGSEQFKSNSTLTPARRMQLEAVGFVWDPHQVLWEKTCLHSSNTTGGSLQYRVAPLRLKCWLRAAVSVFTRQAACWQAAHAPKFMSAGRRSTRLKASCTALACLWHISSSTAIVCAHARSFGSTGLRAHRAGCGVRVRRRNNLALLKGDRQQLLVQLDFPWRGFRRYDTLQRFSRKDCH